MLARRSQLRLPDGTTCDLPILVPSFSSKGCGFFHVRRGKSRVQASLLAGDLLEFGQTPSLSVLISAFDLHFKHFHIPDAARRSCLDWIPQVRIVFLDSGGYELSPDFDSSEPKTPPYEPRDGYGRAEYVALLEGLRTRGKTRNFVVTNFDWATRGRPLGEQLADARAIKRRHPWAIHNFLIKPWSRTMTVVDPRRLSAEGIENLAGFDIIGVTEKELGADLLDRLKRLSQLRAALNDAGIAAPIHVWGGLDPVLTPLYFFAGAEIFDGVSWLRYAFVDGLAVNRECAVVLDEDLGVHEARRFAYPLTALRNRSYLGRLTGFLQQWVDYDATNFSMFPRSSRESLARAYRTMTTKIPELRKGV